VLAAAALLLLSACGGRPDHPLASRHAGSDACAGCHAAETAAWRGSHHAHSMSVATAASVRGDFAAAAFGAGEHGVLFARRGDRFSVTAADRAGVTREFAVTHTFGIEPLQQYLVATGRGRLQALDVAWDTRPAGEGGQRWFRLRDGEPGAGAGPMHFAAPASNWNHACADCHSTGIAKRYDAARDAFDTRFAEVSVACEACHGPAAAHADWQRRRRGVMTRWFAGADPGFVGLGGQAATPGGAARRAWLFDASRPLDFRPGHEAQACAQCHSRRAQLTGAFDAREGFANHYDVELLDGSLYFVDGQIRDEVFEYGSFLQSRMFAKGVTCADCHEPHSLALRRPGNALCLGCHEVRYATAAHHRHGGDGVRADPAGAGGAAGGSRGTRCVDCHMPARTYMTVDPRRDHRFGVPRPDLSVSLGVPNACNDCHDDRDARWALAQVAAWFGPERAGLQQFAPTLDALRRETVDAERLLQRLLEDPSTPLIARATALAEAGPYLTPERLDWVRAGLAAEDPLLRRAALDACESLPMDWRWRVAAGALADPARAVRLRAARLLSAAPSIDAARLARLAPGLAEYRASVAAHADRAEVRTEYGAWLMSRGEFGAARAEFEAALRLEPDFVPAAIDLVDLERAQGRDDRGELLLRSWLARLPGEAALHHAQGLLLARQGRREAAVAALGQAVRLTPQDAGYRYALAVGLDAVGRTREALQRLERERAGGRASRRERVLQAQLLAGQGDRARLAALWPELRALAGVDPGARAALARLSGFEAARN
jgi:predicted CXXCH cytochrome family protein